MAPYIFPRYSGESSYIATSLQLEKVELEYQVASLVAQFDYNNSPKIWRYGSTKEHEYVPEETIKVPFRATDTLAAIDLVAFARNNQNSYFPPNLIGFPWIDVAFDYYTSNPYQVNIQGVSISGTALFFTTNNLTTSTQAQNQPKPPDRWRISFKFINGHRVPPSYENLITGYNRDIRIIPDRLKITSLITQTVVVKYYRNDPYEHIPNREYIDIDRAELPIIIGDDIDTNKSRLKTINWHTQDIKLVANKPIIIDITGIVLGTMVTTPAIPESSFLSWNSDLPAFLYPARYLLNNITYIDELFNHWALLFNDGVIARAFGQSRLSECWITDKRLPLTYDGFNVFDNRGTSLAITEGFNNHWNNYQLPEYNDYLIRPTLLPQPGFNQQISQTALIILSYHPFFQSLPLSPVVPSYSPYDADTTYTIPSYLLANTVNPDYLNFNKAYINYHPFDHANLLNWHLKPQIFNNIDRGIGTVPMDTIRTIEIHKALEAEKYSKNELDSTKDRITTLGWYLENIARVNGLRFDANGDINLAKEKDLYQPKTINNPTLGTPSPNGKYNKYGMSCFGELGMMIPHLPTTYDKNSKELKLFDVVHDIPQLQVAILRQLDVSLSIQHGSEIRINGLDGKIHSYPNQLAVSLECLQRLEKIKYMTERTLLISTTTGTEVRELFSGIGIPVTQKFIPLKDPANSKKTLSLPYFGHQKNKPSTAQLLATVHVNLAVINGVLMPKKQPEKNKVYNPFRTFEAKK